VGYSVEGQKKHWAWMASKYHQKYGLDSPINQMKIKRKADLIAMFTDMHNDKKVLEIGCGTGLFTQYLAETKAHITAIDVSPEMMQMAINRNLKDVKYFLMDGCNISYPKDYFDIVVATYVLQWVDYKKMMQEINRVLKLDGKVAFILDNMINPVVILKRTLNIINSWWIDKTHPSFLWQWELRKVLNKSGFSNVFMESLEFVDNRDINTFIEEIPIINNFGGSLFVVATKEAENGNT
jgi:ubiquinone/menaquinone biosynthesis C-methylase UbiE